MKGEGRCLAALLVVVAVGCIEKPAPWMPGDGGLQDGAKGDSHIADGGADVRRDFLTDSRRSQEVADLFREGAVSDCTTSCDGKQCGDNGCGGSCGECAQDQVCDQGQCLKYCTFVCKFQERECGPAGEGEDCYCGECDDENLCTDDSCDEKGHCQHLPNAKPCDDGDACTLGDECDNEECQPGEQRSCDDGSDCTDDSCLSADGSCLHEPLDQTTCDDGNPCTEEDKCTEGTCKGELLPLEQLVIEECLCTTDENCTALDDANICTGVLECGKQSDEDEWGTCQVQAGSILDCDDGMVCTDDSCHPVDGCLNAQQNLLCDDGNQCTQDVCDPTEGCQHPALDGADCEDGDPCTLEDKCVDDQCEAGLPDNCDDGNPCTDDSCEAEAGCLHVPNTAPCDDQNKCTTTDTCVAEECQGMGEMDCDDGNVCTDDGCASAEGCTHSPNTDECNDGNQCTLLDTCQDGACAGSGEQDCDDEDPCTTDSCDPAAGCLHALASGVACDDKNACTLGDLCAEGICQPGGSTLACDDGNVCTDDSCDIDNGCLNQPLENDTPCLADPHSVCLDGECTCVPDCAGKTCGNDGCGNSCGTCPEGESCQAGQCEVVCGDGQCAAGEEDQCNCPGDCMGGCAGCCQGAVCKAGTLNGDCGKSGVACAACSDGKTCQSQACAYKCGDTVCAPAGNETCVSCPVDCGACCPNGLCDNGETQCTCPEDCKSGCVCCDGEQCVDVATDAQCGKDAGACAACMGQDKCVDGACVVCQPACGGKVCGPDGCGAICGTCPAGKSCDGGQCVVKCGDGQCGAGEDKCNCPADCPGSCAGCCAGTECKAGTLNSECGKNGVACAACTGGKTCQIQACAYKCGDGVCADAGDETACTCPQDCGPCAGCCAAGVCKVGTANAECGKNGVLCTNCPSSWKVCQDGECVGSTWTDPDSGLTWENPGKDSENHWSTAKQRCSNLSLDGGGWHLPTIKELRTLVRGCPATVTGGSCNIQVFDCLSLSCKDPSCIGCSENNGPADGCYWPVELHGKCSPYWSSSDAEDNGSYAWIVYFDTGEVYYSHIYNGKPSRCVR